MLRTVSSRFCWALRNARSRQPWNDVAVSVRGPVSSVVPNGGSVLPGVVNEVAGKTIHAHRPAWGTTATGLRALHWNRSSHAEDGGWDLPGAQSVLHAGRGFDKAQVPVVEMSRLQRGRLFSSSFPSWPTPSPPPPTAGGGYISPLLISAGRSAAVRRLDAVDTQWQQSRRVSVDVRNNNVESALRKMKRLMVRDGFIRQLRSRRRYWKPSELKLLKAKESDSRIAQHQVREMLKWIMSHRSRGF